jgi:endothelin-converting enzyme/putative endopeptidase
VYNVEAPGPVVFGAMGTAIGRRMAEALEGEGRLRGPEGNPGDWWTPAAASEFEARSACLVEQYDAYEPVPGVRIDGRRTLAGNLAELAGLRAAYEAMRADRMAHPASDTRVLGFTPDQQFFVAYAQTLCTAATEADLADQAAHGARPPARFQVNGPLSNLPEFARAFRCDEGSPMVRPAAARCDVW